MKNTKTLLLLAVYITGLIVNIFFKDSVIPGYLIYFNWRVWVRMLFFLIPIAFLWLYLLRISEDWWINFFGKHHYRENDFINAPAFSSWTSAAFTLMVLFLTIELSSFLNGKYNRFFINKDYSEPEISEITDITMHYDLLAFYYGSDSATDIYCAGLLVDNNSPVYRVCCKNREKLPENQFKEQLKKSVKVRISNRNNNYFYPICP